MQPTRVSNIAVVLEEEAMLRDKQTLHAFRERANAIRQAVLSFAHAEGPLYGYGAAAKGNTLLNWCGLASPYVLAVGDTTPAKQGKYLPGSRIPIISEAALIERQPAWVLILPWNWRAEIVAKLTPQLPYTVFVTPMDL